MKGLGGAYGCDYITTAGVALEGLSRAGRLDEAGPRLEALAEYLERVVPRKTSKEA